MKARMQAGYWIHNPPIGYRYERVSGHGKMLVRDEPIASIIAEALEGYASGRFEGLVEIKRFLESQPAYPRNSNNEVHIERVVEMKAAPSADPNAPKTNKTTVETTIITDRVQIDENVRRGTLYTTPAR